MSCDILVLPLSLLGTAYTTENFLVCQVLDGVCQKILDDFWDILLTCVFVVDTPFISIVVLVTFKEWDFVPTTKVITNSSIINFDFSDPMYGTPTRIFDDFDFVSINF